MYLHLCIRSGILILKYPYRLFNLKTDLEDLARVEKNTRSYCGKGSRLPAPSINVISNSHFGFQISESGAGMTWSENSRENRLTPWSNDPISDPVDSAIYIRDEESGDFWSATPAPSPGTGTYVVTHGAGYTRFQHGGRGIKQDLMCFTALEHPTKILKLRLRNTTRRARWLSVTNYIDLVLGVWKSKSAPFVVTSIDEITGALLAMNSYNNEFAGRVVFSSVNDRKTTISGDRTSYLGRNGTMQNPAAMKAAYLSGRVGAGLDPCHALQSKIKLEPFGEHTLVFLLGEGKTINEVRSLVHQFQTQEAAEEELQNVQKYWDRLLGGIQIETPDRATDLLLNHWLLYQALSCRFWVGLLSIKAGGHSVSATSCRMRWPLCIRIPHFYASIYCVPHPASFRKEMCSTGGIHLPDAECALAVRTIYSGFPLLPLSIPEPRAIKRYGRDRAFPGWPALETE